MLIPFMRTDRQFEEIQGELLPAVHAVLASGRVLQSPEVERFESRLAALHGLRHGVALNSGSDAVSFALAAAELPEGSPVAVPAMTFVASAAAIAHQRLRPVFVDLDPDTLLPDGAALLELVRREAVRAVVVVHLYGQLLELEEIAREARARGIAIIEDAAQALGATRHGRSAGAHSAATCLSFDPTKVIGAAGSGGALLTDDDAVAATARLLRYHGHAGSRIYTRPGFNSQLDSVQAAVLDVKLNHLQRWQQRRAQIAADFTRALAPLAGLRLPRLLPGNVHNWHKYVLRAQQRDALQKHLAERGVQTQVHYTVPLHQQPCFAPFGPYPALPHAEQAAAELLSLPMYPELTDVEVRHITDSVAEFMS